MNTEENNKSTEAKHVLPAVFFFGIKVIKYRIIRDNYAGFECQKWRCYYPFWVQMGFVNTNLSLEQAIGRIENDISPVVLAS